MDFLSRATISKGLKCVFIFIKKSFSLYHDDLNCVPMEGLVSKPLIIHSEFTKDVWIYTSLLIDNKVEMTLFYIVFTFNIKWLKGFLLCSRYYCIKLFETLKIKKMSLRAISKIPFDLIYSNRKGFPYATEPRSFAVFKCLHTLQTRSRIVNLFFVLVTISQIWLLVKPF